MGKVVAPRDAEIELWLIDSWFFKVGIEVGTHRMIYEYKTNQDTDDEITWTFDMACECKETVFKAICVSLWHNQIAVEIYEDKQNYYEKLMNYDSIVERYRSDSKLT